MLGLCWAMPKHIEFALVLSRFYVGVPFLPGFSYNQLSVLAQCFSGNRAVDIARL